MASASLRWRCRACRGPVVPGVPGDGRPRSHAELGALVAAHRSRAMAVGWTAASGLLGATSAAAFGLVAALWTTALPSAIVFVVVAAACAALSATCARRARARNRDVRASLDHAWRVVAEEISATATSGREAGHAA